MRRCLKLLFSLVCIQWGYGHTLPALLAGGGDPASPDDQRAPLQRPRRSPPDTLAPACGLRSAQLRVRDLGLGYDSDETVLFRYCGGACARVRSNHDLALAHLLLGGALPLAGPDGERPGPGGPCCRPTHHEDLAFLDNAHRWHKVEKLLAAGCSCVG